MATMTDVAALAGVSTATVSHVINGTRFVREETRELVLEAIRRTGYTPNTIARSLVTASTNTIGLVLSATMNPYFGELVQAIDASLGPKGYSLLLSDSHDDPAGQLSSLRGLLQRRVDGMIVAPAADPTGEAMAQLAAAPVPTVLVDRLASADFDQVGAENVNATAALVGHLVEAGHRRIAFVAGLAGLITTEERLAGYRLGLERAQLPYDRKLVVYGRSDALPAHDGVLSLLRSRRRPTAVVVGNNHMTIGTVQALREAGLRVPGDIALAVYDDFEWADFFHPRLTAMAQPVEEIGRTAVELLLRRLVEPDRLPQTVRLDPRFVHRDSCGCHDG